MRQALRKRLSETELSESTIAAQERNFMCSSLLALVFAGSESEALEVVDRIQAGAISINDAALTALIHEEEKNAFKYSGMGGSRMGGAALERFMRRKAYLIKTKPVTDLWWYV